MAPTINSSSSGSKSSPDSLSCVTCRSRKLKCDRVRPVCTRCQRADGGTQCVYPESKRRPTFKRRNVRDLEDRLAQVEHYLKDASKGNDREGTPAAPTTAPEAEAAPAAAPELVSDQQEPIISLDMPDFSSDNIGDTLLNDAQLISLGISESLPPPHIMVELYVVSVPHCPTIYNEVY